MTVSASFKILCPTCDNAVLVKDRAVVGKKVSCPTCKAAFVCPAPGEGAKASDGAKAAKPAPAVPAAKKPEPAAAPPAKAAAKPAAAPPAKAAAKPAAAAPAKATAPPAKAAAPKKPPIDDDDDDDGEQTYEMSDEKPANGAAAAKAGSKKAVEPEVLEDEDEAVEESPKKPAAKAAKKPAAAADAKPRAMKPTPKKKAMVDSDSDEVDVTEEEPEGKEEVNFGDDDDDDPFGDKETKANKKAKKLSDKTKKLYLGLGLAGVGLVILVVAAVLMSGPGKKQVASPGTFRHDGQDNIEDDQTTKSTKKNTELQPGSTGKSSGPTLGAAQAGRFTNLLPNDCEHVFHLHLGAVQESPLGEAVFQTAGAFNDDEELRHQLGFSLRGIDEVLRGESFSKKWAFTAVHSTYELQESELVKALHLTPAKDQKSPKHKYFQLTQPHPWLTQLGKLTMMPRQHLADPTERPTFVHLLDRQTLIVADLQPLLDFLKHDGAPPLAPGADDLKLPPMGLSVPLQTYKTIHPELKTMLHRMETRPDRGARVLFSSATDMHAARFAHPIQKGQIAYRLRQSWDVTTLLAETQPRAHYLGTALLKKENNLYVFQNGLTCDQQLDARTLKVELASQAVPEVATFLDQLLDHKVDFVKEAVPTAPMIGKVAPPMPMLDPRVGEPMGMAGDHPLLEETAKSRLRVLQNDKEVSFLLDLVLDGKAMGRFQEMAALAMVALRGELNAASPQGRWHAVAQGLKLLSEKGDPTLRAGMLPQAAYPRLAQSAVKRTARDPAERVSWIAALLPHLGHPVLANNVHKDYSWHDSRNWLAAATLVPELIDPSYPAALRKRLVADIPFDVATTHIVGIAGVGQDAPNYPLDHPNAGAFGYERMLSLDALKKGRGLSNVAVMIQVPPTTPVGMTPWLAGGGATVRSVPEKDSIKPFVGDHSGRRGTYVIMGDGSVRFVSDKIDDAVFKALCTVNGKAPASEWETEAAVVPSPGTKKEEPKGKDTGKTTAPTKETGKSTGKATEPAKDTGKSTAPAKETGKATTPSKETAPTKETAKSTPPVKDTGKATAPAKATEKKETAPAKTEKQMMSHAGERRRAEDMMAPVFLVRLPVFFGRWDGNRHNML